jgi:RNA polymerase sigma-70 factor (ECF subfamily)
MIRRNQDAYARHLHQRLLQRDPVAPAELAEAFLEVLVRRVRARARSTQDDSLVYDAVVDALLAYVQEPAKFDPAKSSLLTYLTMSAYGDLRNALARERRRKKREVPLEDVEHRLSVGNSPVEAIEDAILERYGISTPEGRTVLLRRVSEEFPDPQDRRLLDLMLHDERKTAAYSAVLGIQGSSPEEQRQTVKRHKDRITKRLQRLRGKLREQEGNR